MIAWLRVPAHRRYVYRVTTGLLVLAGFYGLLGPEEVQAWTAFLGVALVTGLADANTGRGEPGGDG